MLHIFGYYIIEKQCIISNAKHHLSITERKLRKTQYTAW